MYVKERLVICNEEDTDGRARVTRDEERVVSARWYLLVHIKYCYGMSSVRPSVTYR